MGNTSSKLTRETRCGNTHYCRLAILTSIMSVYQTADMRPRISHLKAWSSRWQSIITKHDCWSQVCRHAVCHYSQDGVKYRRDFVQLSRVSATAVVCEAVLSLIASRSIRRLVRFPNVYELSLQALFGSAPEDGAHKPRPQAMTITVWYYIWLGGCVLQLLPWCMQPVCRSSRIVRYADALVVSIVNIPQVFRWGALS